VFAISTQHYKNKTCGKCQEEQLVLKSIINTYFPLQLCQFLKSFGEYDNLWIRNNYLKITNDHGMLHSECHKCLFALNGQPDDEGQENEDIYIGANRVVDGAYRAGVGLCSIKLRWVNH
jgi:hypothetical protein